MPNTTREKIGFDFTKYVSLNILGMLGLSGYILADTYFIAKGLGVNGLTSLNFAIPIYSFIHGVGLMLGVGGATLFTIRKSSSGDFNKVFMNTLLGGFFASIIFIIIGLFFSNTLSIVLGATGETVGMTTIYLKTILVMSPLFICNNILLCYIRNDNNPRLSMIGMVVGSLCNILLDWIFVINMDMGMFGAAFATGIAPLISILILSSHILKKKNTFKLVKAKFEIKLLTRINLSGIHSLIAELSSGIVIIAFNIVILRLTGNIGVAAYGIIANLSLIVISIFTAIGQAIQPLVSRFYGEGFAYGQKKVYKYGIILSLIIGVLVYVLMYIFPNQIASIFSNKTDNPHLSLATSGIRLYFIGTIFSGITIVTCSFLSSVQKVTLSFTLSIIRGFVLIMPLLPLLSFAFGLTGVWLVMPAVEIITAIISIVLYKSYITGKNK